MRPWPRRASVAPRARRSRSIVGSDSWVPSLEARARSESSPGGPFAHHDGPRRPAYRRRPASWCRARRCCSVRRRSSSAGCSTGPNLPFQAGILTVRLALAVVGLRYVVEGAEHILDRPAVYCVNHTSNVEPPILFAALRRLTPRLHILYKAELRKLPILNLGFDLVGFVPIDRGNREQTTQAIDTASRRLNAGDSFLIFPEGTRIAHRRAAAVQQGGVRDGDARRRPIVPIAISGARDAMRKGSPIIRPATVRLRLGAPIETRGLGERSPRRAGTLGAGGSAAAAGRADLAGGRRGRQRETMELLVTLGRTLGFSFAAGVNLYATVAILGLASRFDWVDLPPQFEVFDNNWVIGIAHRLLRRSSSSPTRCRGSTRRGTPCTR